MAFREEWMDMNAQLAETLRSVLPGSIEKSSVHYDLAKSPEKYVECTRRLCRLLGEQCKVHFLPSRRSWVPCHVKFDTESVLQMFISYKRRVEWRKRFGEDRKSFNIAVWESLVKAKVMASKSRHFEFHHEITTDGVAVSMLYSRVASKRACPPIDSLDSVIPPDRTENLLPSKVVGLDPGKKNVVTMVDADGNVTKYSARQRNFESKLTRFRTVLESEKKKAGIDKLESSLSQFFGKSNVASEYEEYLVARATVENKLTRFYGKEKWRGFKFRIFCYRRSSEHMLLNRIALKYGGRCVVKFGNWSRRSQMKGCQPTPNLHLKKLISRRFRVDEVDEFRTSKICNLCMGSLKSYRTKSGRLSYSRLCCETCGGKGKKPSKRFVNRDVNAAMNILLCGTSAERPLALARQIGHSDAMDKSRPVAAGRKSSDPISISIEMCVTDSDLSL